MLGPTRLIIFDVGNVLIRHDNALLVRRLAARCARPALARKMLDDLIIGSRFLSERDGRVDLLYRELAGRYGFSLGRDGFEQVFCSHFSPAPGMEDLLRDLSVAHRLVVLSNTNRVHWNHWIAHYPIMQIPHARYASHELGAAKPDRACYRRVLEQEGYAGQTAVFIDDQPKNTAAAAQFGMATVTFTGRAALAKSLRGMGIHSNAGEQKG